ERREYDDIEANIVRADGAQRRVVITLHPLPEEDGKTIGFVTTMRDITRRSAAETQLRLLADLAAGLSAMNEPEDVGRFALGMIMPIVDADIGSLLQLDPDDDVLRMVSSVGARAQDADRFRQIPLDLPSPAVDAVRLRELVVVTDDPQGEYPLL